MTAVRPRPNRWLTPAAGILSGLLLALAFPPFELVILLPVALVAWVVALAREESRGRALLSGFLLGMAFWCASIPWIVYVVTHYGGQSGVMGVVCLLLLAAILGEWPAMVGWGVVAVASPESNRRLIAFPLLWIASEHARSYFYGGFPWNLTGHALYRHPLWMQSASIWGIFGLGLGMAAIAALLSAAVLRRSFRPALGAAFVILLVGVLGTARLAAPSRASRSLSVALLQPNLSEEGRARDTARSYTTVIAQAREASKGVASLIVIPESALPVYWDRSATLRRDLAEIADRGSAILFNDVEETSDGRYYNVARLLTRGERQARPYRKVHLVPFGEYVPLPKIFFFVRQISSEIGAFSAAEHPTLLEAGETRIGVGVCYEVTYPSLVRDEVASGANLLATISNDSWYGKAGAQEQHLAGAVLRTVENRRYLLRAAITGISAIVDEKGRIVAEAGPDRTAIVRGIAWLFQEQTAWRRWGYWIPRVADVLALLVVLFGAARWLTERRMPRPRARAKS